MNNTANFTSADVEAKLLEAPIEDGCALIFSVASDIGNPAIANIVERSLGISQAFFEVVVGHYVVSVIPKLNKGNWIYKDVIQISRYAIGFDGMTYKQSYKFVDVIDAGCTFLKHQMFEYVKHHQQEAKLITAFAERYMK